MIRINLLPRERQLRWRPGPANGAGVAPRLLLVATLLLIGVWFWSLRLTSRQLAREIAEVEAEAARLAPLLEVVRQLESRQAHLQQRTATVAKLRGVSASVGPLLEAVATEAPAGLWLLELTYRERQLTIKGAARSLSDVSTLIAGLETSRLFRQPIELLDTERATLDRERETVTFTLRAMSN